MFGKFKVLGKTQLEKRKKKSYAFLDNSKEQKAKQTNKVHESSQVSYCTGDLEEGMKGAGC